MLGMHEEGTELQIRSKKCQLLERVDNLSTIVDINFSVITTVHHYSMHTCNRILARYDISISTFSGRALLTFPAVIACYTCMHIIIFKRNS